MKTRYLLFCFCLFTGLAKAQTTYIVDNNANGIGDYSTLNAAITAASPGDIILLVPSVTSYGNLTLTNTGKRLTIAGGGANGPTGMVTKLDAISLNGGSAANTNLDGFVLGGFECKSIEVNFVDSVKIKAVKTTEVIASTNYQLRVRNSSAAEIEFVSTANAYFSSNDGMKVFHSIFSGEIATTLLEIQTTNQFIVSNSLMANNVQSQSALTIDASSTGMVTNNVLWNGSSYQKVDFGGAVLVINNIIGVPSYGNYGYTISGGQSYQSNMFYNNYGVVYITNNTTGGILTIAATADAYGNIYADPKLNSTTYRLQDGSPGIDFGSGNDLDGSQADVGVYGGLDPMPDKLPNNAVGVSVVPSVTNLQLSLPTAVTGGKVILNVSGQSKKN